LGLTLLSFEDESGRRSAAKLLSKDEARPIASNIARCVLASIAKERIDY